jgi:hypothetical protein
MIFSRYWFYPHGGGRENLVSFVHIKQRTMFSTQHNTYLRAPPFSNPSRPLSYLAQSWKESILRLTLEKATSYRR